MWALWHFRPCLPVSLIGPPYRFNLGLPLEQTPSIYPAVHDWILEWAVDLSLCSHSSSLTVNYNSQFIRSVTMLTVHSVTIFNNNPIIQHTPVCTVSQADGCFKFNRCWIYTILSLSLSDWQDTIHHQQLFEAEIRKGNVPSSSPIYMIMQDSNVLSYTCLTEMLSYLPLSSWMFVTCLNQNKLKCMVAHRNL